MLYDFECNSCKKIKEINMPMKEYTDNILCDCGLKMDRIFLPVTFNMGTVGRMKKTQEKYKEQGMDVVPYEPGIVKKRESNYNLSKEAEAYISSL